MTTLDRRPVQQVVDLLAGLQHLECPSECHGLDRPTGGGVRHPARRRREMRHTT
jgi:hypothetical protein